MAGALLPRGNAPLVLLAVVVLAGVGFATYASTEHRGPRDVLAGRRDLIPTSSVPELLNIGDEERDLELLFEEILPGEVILGNEQAAQAVFARPEPELALPEVEHLGQAFQPDVRPAAARRTLEPHHELLRVREPGWHHPPWNGCVVMRDRPRQWGAPGFPLRPRLLEGRRCGLGGLRISCISCFGC